MQSSNKILLVFSFYRTEKKKIAALTQCFPIQKYTAAVLLSVKINAGSAMGNHRDSSYRA